MINQSIIRAASRLPRDANSTSSGIDGTENSVFALTSKIMLGLRG